jgi:hypothetical protein
MNVSLADRLVVPDRVVTRAVSGTTVLLNTETGRYFTLDEIGTRSWTLLTSCASIGEARDRLLAEFAADPAALTRDLEALVDELARRGLVETSSG